MSSQLHQWADFNAANLLPNSVYLWACDESQPGDRRPSRSDAVVAWIVIITQILCYIQLIIVSSTGISDDSSASASEIVGSYSLMSVAAAMYLMMSIAAADLGAGIALLFEARTKTAKTEIVQLMNIWRWVQRKMFGLMLLLSFVLLATASVRVLFRSSLEDVDVVVGAAAVLFIADVDEKLMVVLNVIPSNWRLFWVLEAIGLSVTFALLGLRTTGNGDEVAEDSHAGCKYGGSKTTPEEGCFIYKWHYIFQYIPVSVTIVSLLLNAIVACPKRFFKRHVLRSNCWKEWLFALILVLWIIEAMLDQFYFDAWKMEAMGLFLGTYATGMATWGIFKAYKRVFCGRFYQSTANYMYSLWTSRSRIGLFYIPAGMFVFSIIMTAIAAITGLTGLEINILDPTWDPFIVTQAIGYLAYEAWLLWGMCRNCNNVKTSDIAEELESMAEPREGRLRPLLPSVNLLLGWAHTKALYCFKGLCESGLVFPYIKRTGNGWVYLPSFAMYACAWLLTSVCSAASNRKGLAFWAVAKYLLDDVAYCLWMLIYATMEGSIK